MRKFAILALSLVGLFDSLYLLRIYTSPSSPMVCVGGGCDAARASSYSHLWGLPLPAYGAVAYFFLALLMFLQPLVSAFLARMAQYGILAISGSGFVFSLYLTEIEAFDLHAWCMWCVLSAISVTAIFALGIVDVSRSAVPLEPAKSLGVVKRNFVLILAAFVIGVPAFILLSRHGELPPTPPPSAHLVKQYLLEPDTHFYGNLNAPVTVVEFGDFQCPACGYAETASEQIRRNYGNRIRFAFRQFPLRNFHAHAEKAAEASECAAAQGKFWEAVQTFYANQNDLSLPALNRYSAGLGLDSKKFVECLQSGQMVSRVTRDIDDGKKLGVHATPTFFIDGNRVEQPLNYAQFSQIIELELREKGAAQAGTASNTEKSGSAAPGQMTAAPVSSGGSDSAAPLLGGNGTNAFSALQGSATACSEDEAKMKQPDMIRTAEAKELFQNRSQTLFVDVRSASAFHSGHIPGAVNVPIEHFEQDWTHLPKGKTIVLYEDGRAKGDVCAASRAAGRILLAQGFESNQVKVYQDGLAGWQKAALPVGR